MATAPTGKYAEINYKELVAAVEAMNEVMDQPEFKIKIVAAKKEDIISKFVSNMAAVIKEGQEAQLPEIVREFYQTRLLPVADNARPFGKSTEQRIQEKNKKNKEAAMKKKAEKTEAAAPVEKTAPLAKSKKEETKKFVIRKSGSDEAKPVSTQKKTSNKAAAPVKEAATKKDGKKGAGVAPTAATPAVKKDGKKSSETGTRRSRGNGMVARAVELYVVQGITDTKDIAAVIDKEFPGTNNRSTIGHVRCILGNIPKGFLKKPAPTPAAGK